MTGFDALHMTSYFVITMYVFCNASEILPCFDLKCIFFHSHQCLTPTATVVARAAVGMGIPMCQGYVPLTMDVVRVAFKVPLALRTPL